MSGDRAGGDGIRALLVAPQPLYEDRGTPIAVHQVLRALSERGDEVDVLTYPVGEDFSLPAVHVERVGNPLRFSHVPIGFSLRKVFLDTLLAFRLARRLRTRSYTYVHAVEESAFIAALLLGKSGPPLLYDMQSSIPQQLEDHPLFGRGPVQRALELAERWLLRRADLVVASRGLGRHVNAVAPATPCREWRFAGLPPSIDAGEATAARTSLGLGPDARLIVYAGTFEEYQGLASLVRAAARVVRTVPEAAFVLVGAGPREERALEDLAAGLGVEDRVRVISRQPRATAHAYLSLAEIAISPRSSGDNLPVKIFDYMMAGLPIVATAIPAHTSLLDERIAVLVEPDPGGLADGIRYLLRNPRRAADLAARARARAERDFGWADFVDSVGAQRRWITRDAVRAD